MQISHQILLWSISNYSKLFFCYFQTLKLPKETKSNRKYHMDFPRKRFHLRIYDFIDVFLERCRKREWEDRSFTFGYKWPGYTQFVQTCLQKDCCCLFIMIFLKLKVETIVQIDINEFVASLWLPLKMSNILQTKMR